MSCEIAQCEAKNTCIGIDLGTTYSCVGVWKASVTLLYPQFTDLASPEPYRAHSCAEHECDVGRVMGCRSFPALRATGDAMRLSMTPIPSLISP